MKNILVLNYEFPPLGWWASPVSYEISKWYVQLWYRVDVVTMGFKDLPDFQVVEGINVYRVKCLRTKKQLCHPWEQATYLYYAYKKVKELMKDKKYYFCHCHFIIPTWFLAMKLKREFGLNYIITAHGSDVLWHNPRFAILYKLVKNQWINIIKNSQKVVSPSKYLWNKISQYLWSDELVQTIPNWIQKDKFLPMEKQKYILVVARLVHWKWIQDLFESIKDISLWEWKIKIVWEWPFRWELDKIVDKYSLQDKVEFVGWVDNQSEEMKNLYGHASIFCQPSLFENASIVLLEAMQAWCAVLARNIGGNPETISQDQLFEDIDELKEKLTNFLSNENKVNSIAYENVQRIQNYQREVIVKKYEWEFI